MRLTKETLDHFIANSDELGGPTTSMCREYWSGLSYEPSHSVNQDLDPFSEEYVAEQMLVYEEIAGHKYDVQLNEVSNFILDHHVLSSNPYNHPEPATLAMHVQRLSLALKLAKPGKGAHLLDMGCGWGLSSELAAYIGLTVTAVDVNPLFVELVNQRAMRTGLPITALLSTFEDYRTSMTYDLCLFYECLHHAIRPWYVINRVTPLIKNGGRIALVGEPINNIWWRHWGLRLDALSIYCIRKFGWFESGWSLEFLLETLQRAGLRSSTYYDPDPEIGCVIVAERGADQVLDGSAFGEFCSGSTCLTDGTYLIFLEQGNVVLSLPDDVIQVRLNLTNFRPTSLNAEFHLGNTVAFRGALPQGPTQIAFYVQDPKARLHFTVESWIPSQETNSLDSRTLGVHLDSVELVRRPATEI